MRQKARRELTELRSALEREEVQRRITKAHPGFELTQDGSDGTRPWVAVRRSGLASSYSSYHSLEGLLEDLTDRYRHHERRRTNPQAEKGTTTDDE